MCCIFNAMLYDNTLWKDSDRFVNGSNECEEHKGINEI